MHRANVLKSFLQRAEELKDEEEALHERMDPIVADVNRDKRLILLDELAKELRHPDHTLVEEIAFGFELVGWMPKTDLFEAPTRKDVRFLFEISDCVGRRRIFQSLVAIICLPNDQLNPCQVFPLLRGSSQDL